MDLLKVMLQQIIFHLIIKDVQHLQFVKMVKNLFDVTLSTTGKHNILNALATICTSLILNIPNEAIINGLAECKGAHKRFEYKGEFNGATVIDDYAHHPVEIKATLNTAKLIEHNKIYCVFQPHTYTRTKTFI